MQTFLPDRSFAKSAYVLDNKRLGKQRAEVIQILNALRLPNYGWQNHPAVRMWRDHEFTLCDYGISMCKEWIRRGFNDTCFDKISRISNEIFWNPNRKLGALIEPPWINDQRVHISHQSNLVRKLPEHYRQHFPHVRDDIPYYWPSHDYEEAA